MKNQQLHSLSDRLMGATTGLQMLCDDVRQAKDAEKQEAVGNHLGRFIAELQQMQSELSPTAPKEAAQ